MPDPVLHRCSVAEGMTWLIPTRKGFPTGAEIGYPRRSRKAGKARGSAEQRPAVTGELAKSSLRARLCSRSVYRPIAIGLQAARRVRGVPKAALRVWAKGLLPLLTFRTWLPKKVEPLAHLTRVVARNFERLSQHRREVP